MSPRAAQYIRIANLMVPYITFVGMARETGGAEPGFIWFDLVCLVRPDASERNQRNQNNQPSSHLRTLVARFPPGV